MFTFHRMSYLTAFRRQINQVYIWHQILVSWKGLILFMVFLLLPKNMLWKLTGWSLTMVEVDCQSFSGVPFFKKIQAHNTSRRLYLDYIPKRQICCKHAEISCILFGTWELNFVPICVFSICCADFHPILFRGGHIHFVGLYLSISACNKHPNILKFQL